MRSDRNPYFLLRNSKDARVKQLLAQAEHMTSQEIMALEVKPDVKKAMLFVATVGQVAKSVTTAEALADRMQTAHVSKSAQYEIYKYVGMEQVITTPNKNQLIIAAPFVFMKQNNRIFVSHNWLNLSDGNNHQIMNQCHLVGLGDSILYNKLTQDLIRQRHNI